MAAPKMAPTTRAKIRTPTLGASADKRGGEDLADQGGQEDPSMTQHIADPSERRSGHSEGQKRPGDGPRHHVDRRVELPGKPGQGHCENGEGHIDGEEASEDGPQHPPLELPVFTGPPLHLLANELGLLTE